MSLNLVHIVEKKWRSLRTQYSRERAKMKKRKSGDGLDDVYETTWQYYNQLLFVDDYVSPKESHSNLKVHCTNYITLFCHGTLPLVDEKYFVK